MKRKINEQCPLQSECGRNCERKGREQECDYYRANLRPGVEGYETSCPAPSWAEEIVDVDHEVIRERTLDVIAAEILVIDAQVCQTVIGGAVEIGLRLEEAKALVGHGNWEDWCEENLRYSKSKAERFMRIASEYGQEDSPYLAALAKTSTLTDLSISKALALLQVPENEVEGFAEQNDLAEMTVRELEEEVKRMKAERGIIRDEYVALDNEYKALQDQLAAMRAEKEALQTQVAEAKGVDGEIPVEIQKRLDKLESSLEKKKKAEQTLKEQLSEAEKQREVAIEQAKEAALSEAREAANKEAAEELERIKAEARAAEERTAAAEKKASLAGNQELLAYKLNMAAMQESLNRAEENISAVEKADPEQAEKMRKAAITVLRARPESLEG